MSAGLEDTQPAARESGPLLPSKISRFEVLEKLGEGGNGLVYLAVDPTLDRKVAVKVLRRGGHAGAGQRLLREAQSAAKLAHESVIVVHEVGTFEGQVYVAMEHVSGGTLTEWQRGNSWRDVLAIYVRAGRGLAAAHAAGMVHRDFKPDNVLVADDGRVRVTDFGLVAVSSGKPPEEARDLALTATGTVMGTPRYMAPEQHLGEEVDARADQFAFCAALYEALFGRPPFDGDTYGALADHVLAGELVPPPAGSPVPAAIRAAIQRGLSRDREGRFATMHELLAALTPSAPSRRRWLLIALASLVVAAGGVFAVARYRHDRDPVEEAFHRAQAAFDRGDYATAVAGFKQALLVEPEPAARGALYTWNIALAYDRMNDCVSAATEYRRYLATAATRATERPIAEQRLRALGDCHKPDETADDALKIGEDAYSRGDFQAAAAAFKRAYALDPGMTNTPKYFFDIGQAYRQLGECAQASFAYTRYLALKPDVPAEKRTMIEGWVKDLDACAAQQGSATR